MSEQEKAEQLKKELYYEPDSGFGSDEECDMTDEYCDYTGEECIGDRSFCEDCPILTDQWEDDAKEIKAWAKREHDFPIVNKSEGAP